MGVGVGGWAPSRVHNHEPLVAVDVPPRTPPHPPESCLVNNVIRCLSVHTSMHLREPDWLPLSRLPPPPKHFQVKNMIRWLSVHTTGVVRVDLRRPTAPLGSEQYNRGNILVAHQGGGGPFPPPRGRDRREREGPYYRGRDGYYEPQEPQMQYSQGDTGGGHDGMGAATERARTG